jgi:RNA recognition motif-containing protein
MELISKLQTCGELELIRSARERMSQIFPLTPKLWLQWINDEIKIASNEVEKNNVLKLFDRSVNDYLSPELWLEYVQYSIGLMNSLGVEGVRRIFERALTSVGLHVSNGALIWDAFREFESFILQTIDKQLNEDIKKQIDTVFGLFKRQLSVPLIGMDNTYKECELWCNGIKDNYGIDLKFATIKSSYEKAFKELEKLIPYEESLLNSEPPHLEQYLRYIEYESINGSPMRVQTIFERALTDNCLVSDLWLKYTKYQDKKVVVDSILIPIYERAVRNCPWSSSLWINYLRALERLKSTHEKVMNVFETALQSGFQQSDEYLQLWLSYLEYLRRKTNWKEDNEVKSLRKTLEKAVEHLSNIENGDPNSVLQFWAKIEAKFCGNMEKARDIWNKLLSSRSVFSSQVQNWIEFSNFERRFGDDKHYRKALLRGLISCSDWPESIGHLLITFEREEGESIESYEEVMEKYESVIKKITEKRKIAAEKEIEERKQMKVQRKQEKYELKRASKRKNEENESQTEVNKYSTTYTDSEGFKVPKMSTSVSYAKKSKLETDTKSSDRSIKESTRVDTSAEYPTHGISYKGDGSKDLQTVFVSNLDFKVNEQQIRDAFEKFGKIDDLRLVRNYKGLSKGYCYVEYSSIESVREALKHDRMPLEGRPVFISEMGKRPKFNFSNSLEKHKIFVKNLSPDIKEEELKKIFEKYGSVKEVRIVTYRNGYSKGCAYIEYHDEVSAKEAIKQGDGMLVADKNISVALSNPTAKPNKREDYASLGSGSTQFTSSTGT